MVLIISELGDRVRGGRGADRPGADRHWGGSTGTQTNAYTRDLEENSLYLEV